MTPAVRISRQAGIDFSLHTYEHDPASRSYGMEAATKLGIEPARVFKTLIAECTPGGFVMAVVPVSRQLDLKALAAAHGVKKAAMAATPDAERLTGYVAGGISPLGGKRNLPTVIDDSACSFDRIYVSAGKRGLDLSLAPDDLVRLSGAAVAAIAS